MNVICFLIQLAQGPGLDRFVYVYGFVPARYTTPDISLYFSTGQQAFSLISFMFLHGGFWHLLGNMWTLYIFGNNVEDRLGPFRYIIFYMFCGVTSGLSHFVFNLHSDVACIGASGAVAGVMGAYSVLHPGSKILTLIPIIIIPYFIEIPAVVFLGLWFLLQVINAAGDAGTGIAWWAHIGGFISGILFLKALDTLPASGITDRARHLTAKKTSHRLQMVRPSSAPEDSGLYGTVFVTPYEAEAGTRKLVNIPWGFHKMLYRVVIPPGMTDGKILRLKGLGKIMPDGQRGDILLTVAVRDLSAFQSRGPSPKVFESLWPSLLTLKSNVSST